MSLGFHRCWDCMKHYKTFCDDFVYFFQSNIFKYMIEFYKRNMSHLDNLSLFLNLEQKYSSIYHCALHKNQFYKPCLPYVFAYKEDILPSLLFNNVAIRILYWLLPKLNNCSITYVNYYRHLTQCPSKLPKSVPTKTNFVQRCDLFDFNRFSIDVVVFQWYASGNNPTRRKTTNKVDIISACFLILKTAYDF